MRAALHLRVSSDRQTVENQRAEVEQLARARGYETAVYEELGSAAKRRPVFDRMLADVRAGKLRPLADARISLKHPQNARMGRQELEFK